MYLFKKYILSVLMLSVLGSSIPAQAINWSDLCRLKIFQSKVVGIVAVSIGLLGAAAYAYNAQTSEPSEPEEHDADGADQSVAPATIEDNGEVARLLGLHGAGRNQGDIDADAEFARLLSMQDAGNDQVHNQGGFVAGDYVLEDDNATAAEQPFDEQTLMSQAYELLYKSVPAEQLAAYKQELDAAMQLFVEFYPDHTDLIDALTQKLHLIQVPQAPSESSSSHQAASSSHHVEVSDFFDTDVLPDEDDKQEPSKLELIVQQARELLNAPESSQAAIGHRAYQTISQCLQQLIELSSEDEYIRLKQDLAAKVSSMHHALETHAAPISRKLIQQLLDAPRPTAASAISYELETIRLYLQKGDFSGVSGSILQKKLELREAHNRISIDRNDELIVQQLMRTIRILNVDLRALEAKYKASKEAEKEEED